MRIESYIPILGKITINLLDVSSRFYDLILKQKEFERLSQINHLGLLSYVFPTLNHTRLDYVQFQMVVSEIVENTFKGTTSAQGSVKINDTKYFGNDIVKLWILMSNYGHCKRTIGDEKSIMNYARERKGFRTELLRFIKDDDLKNWANGIIDKMDYVKFHHLISFYRIGKLIRRHKDRREFMDLYRVLLLLSPINVKISDELKVKQLKDIYKNIRSLSIIALDSNNSHLPVNLDILSAIVSFDFGIDQFQGKKLGSLFNPLINILYDKIYLDKNAQTAQRSYELQSAEKIKTLTYPEVIQVALDYGLGDPYELEIKHLFRMKYKLPDNIAISEHHVIVKEFDELDTDFESSFDFNLNTRDAVIDFYARRDFDDKKLLPKFFYGVVDSSTKIIQRIAMNEAVPYIDTISEIAIKTAGLINQADEDEYNEAFQPIIQKIENQYQRRAFDLNRRSYRYLLWTLLRYHLKKELHFDADSELVEKDIGIISVDGYNDAIQMINSKIESEENSDKIHELNHLKRSISRKFNGIIVCCAARITIYNYSLAPNSRKVTDIDSLVCKLNQNTLYIELNETKNTKKPEKMARKDIKDKMLNCLNKKAKGYRVRDVKGYGAKVVIRYK